VCALEDNAHNIGRAMLRDIRRSFPPGPSLPHLAQSKPLGRASSASRAEAEAEAARTGELHVPAEQSQELRPENGAARWGESLRPNRRCKWRATTRARRAARGGQGEAQVSAAAAA